MRSWPRRRWGVAAVTGLLVGLLAAVVIPPSGDGPGWEVPALVGMAALSGLIVASYVRDTGPVHGLRSAWDAGCTSCGRIALVALPAAFIIRDSDPQDGTTAGLALLFLTGALARRLIDGTAACDVAPSETAPEPAHRD